MSKTLRQLTTMSVATILCGTAAQATTVTTFLEKPLVADNSKIVLDVDGDKNVDFVFYASSREDNSGKASVLAIDSKNGLNQILGQTLNYGFEYKGHVYDQTSTFAADVGRTAVNDKSASKPTYWTDTALLFNYSDQGTGFRVGPIASKEDRATIAFKLTREVLVEEPEPIQEQRVEEPVATKPKQEVAAGSEEQMQPVKEQAKTKPKQEVAAGSEERQPPVERSVKTKSEQEYASGSEVKKQPVEEQAKVKPEPEAVYVAKEKPLPEQQVKPKTEIVYTYGWIDVSHGSVIISQYGYNPTGAAASMSAAPSPVPLPAGLPLLLVGLGAFGLARRARR